ncbi:MAG: hypothetical protein J0I48_07810 [Devosia sp.]|uniref:hypothetical protein n=1 Tax=Devosia sp. 66-22 TaxID=1895753 RepID=UPI000928087E|nr:hypothetical protein [Devosia sp. 66-22]MBN9346092.1 hypothetical protein [Devosia sp.]OJX53683.1 MAG: hypothetical protein BGO81_14075 [Devosia sp. 66-22]
MTTERRRMTGREIVIGLVVLIPVFVIAYLGAGALNLPIPQWGISAIAALVGILIWFAIIGRLGGKK